MSHPAPAHQRVLVDRGVGRVLIQGVQDVVGVAVGAGLDHVEVLNVSSGIFGACLGSSQSRQPGEGGGCRAGQGRDSSSRFCGGDVNGAAKGPGDQNVCREAGTRRAARIVVVVGVQAGFVRDVPGRVVEGRRRTGLFGGGSVGHVVGVSRREVERPAGIQRSDAAGAGRRILTQVSRCGVDVVVLYAANASSEPSLESERKLLVPESLKLICVMGIDWTGVVWVVVGFRYKDRAGGVVRTGVAQLHHREVAHRCRRRDDGDAVRLAAQTSRRRSDPKSKTRCCRWRSPCRCWCR